MNEPRSMQELCRIACGLAAQSETGPFIAICENDRMVHVPAFQAGYRSSILLSRSNISTEA